MVDRRTNREIEMRCTSRSDQRLAEMVERVRAMSAAQRRALSSRLLREAQSAKTNQDLDVCALAMIGADLTLATLCREDGEVSRG